MEPNRQWRGRTYTTRGSDKDRARRRQLYPLCVHCLAQGITRQTDEIDHITPLGMGGADTDENSQGLCIPCHAAKSATEDVSHQGAANHPDWLKPSAIPLTIVRGPPCSGKTTHVQTHAGPYDTIIDLDTIQTTLAPTYRHWSGALDPDLFNRAIRLRNAKLGALSRQDTGRAWFIVSAPSPAEAIWWQGKLGGDLVTLHPGIDECKRRAVTRGTPRAIKGVDDWERASRTPWAPAQARPKRMGCDESGWPTSPDHPWNA